LVVVEQSVKMHHFDDMHHRFAHSKPALKSSFSLVELMECFDTDEQKEATAHVDLHEEPVGLHPPLKNEQRVRSAVHGRTVLHARCARPSPVSSQTQTDGTFEWFEVKLQRQTVATTRSILSAGSLSGREW
jgi:hypothetical protein